MVLMRQVFRIKYGYMDRVLGVWKEAMAANDGLFRSTRVLTDISGDNFTLVVETKAESVDALMEALQASFQDPRMREQMGEDMTSYIESGHKDFYTIEYESA